MALSKEEKEYFRPTLKAVKTKQNLKDLIYTLYVDHNYEYRLTLSIIRQKIKTINIQTIIKILEDLDIKRCIQKDNCKSPNGYIQSRSNFYNTNTSTDCKKSQCIDCISFQKTYNSSDENKKYHMDYFQSLKLEEKEDYIIKLHTKHNYNYSEIHKMTRVSQKEILKIIKIYGYKRCANGENCKSLFGPLQKFENFYELKNSLDGYDYTCSYCNKFRIHFEMADEHKKEHMLQFQNFQVLEEKEKFIINLYKEGYESRYLGSITLIGIDEITKILQKYDIKRCGNKLCKTPIQSRKNFAKSPNSSDGLQNRCSNCFNQYYLKNIDKISEQHKLYNFINVEKNLQIKKNYLKKIGKYNTYASQIDFVEKVRRDPKNLELIQVQCKLCKKWFNPTNQELRARIGAINGKYSIGTEYHLYCSQECKDSCPLYNVNVSQLITQQRLKNNNLVKEDFKRIQQELRSYFLKLRNPNRCELCEEEFNQKDLILHHIVPVAIEHMFEADEDNVIFICKDCHSKTHQIDGCQNNQLSQFSQETYLC